MTNGKASGFTLIELIVVIVIMGILLAVAIPKYMDLTEQASKSADDAFVDGLRAATTMLMAKNALGGTNCLVDHSAPFPTGDLQAVTNYWPTVNQITNQMQGTYTNLRYYKSLWYDATNGLWYPSMGASTNPAP